MRTKSILIALGICCCASYMTSCIEQTTSPASTLHPLVDRDDFRDSRTWGKVVTKNLDLSTFTKINLLGNADIKFIQGDELKVEAYGNEKAIEENDITVKDGVLTINSKKNATGIGIVPSIQLIIEAPILECVNVSGSGDIDIEKTSEFESDLSISVSGIGDIELDHITCHELNINITGAGDIDAKKIKCATADIQVSGIGDVKSDIKAENINVQISSAGDVELDVKCQTLNVQANGTGEVELKGKCTTLTKQSGGMARIDTRNLAIEEEVHLR